MNQDTLQAKQAFAQKVYDTVEAYLEANDCTIYASDGVYVDAQLEPTIMNEADAEDPDRFYPLCSLIREDGEIMEADMALVEEIAEEYLGWKIKYVDYLGLMMSSITTIIDAITYVLIAFVAISLVVSSIMIGIITYVSVVERIKEIAINGMKLVEDL